MVFYAVCLNAYFILSTYFIHSSADGNLGYFHVLAIIDNTAMNIGVYMSSWINVFFYFFQLYTQE